MPLIVFIGISSAGALFLIVFFAQLCSEHCHHARKQWSGLGASEPEGAARSGQSADRLIPLTLATRSEHKSVVVLRRRIEWGRSNRRNRIPGERAHVPGGEAWQ
jgi:hypothetical protein